MHLSLTRISFSDMFAASHIEQVEALLSRRGAVVLFSGPDGCGKTTTLLVAGCEAMYTEDNEKVMILGSISDADSAYLAAETARRGGLALSVISADDAIEAWRLAVEYGIESSDIAGIIAQKLLRKICSNCITSYTAPPDILARIGMVGQNVALYRGEGCPECENTGFRGRLAIHELLILNDKLHTLMCNSASLETIRNAAQQSGMRTFRQGGIQRALEGHTTIEEVFNKT